MNSLMLMQEINNLLSLFVLRINTGVASELYDQNKISENILIPVLTEVLGLPDLFNLNEMEKKNFPGIDLADKNKRIAIQVTSSAGLKKIKTTLETFFRHNLDSYFDQIFIYILTERQKTYSSDSIASTLKAGFDFDASKNIIDYTFISSKLSSLSLESLNNIHHVLHTELSFIESKVTSPIWRSSSEFLNFPNKSGKNPEQDIYCTIEQLANQEKYDEAIVFAKEQLNKQKHDIRLLFVLASTYFNACRFKDSLAIINQALQITPENPNILFLKACALTELGTDSNSINCFIEAKEIFKGFLSRFDRWEYFYNYGNVLSSLGEFETAKQMYDEAIRLDDSHPQVHCNLGTTYHQLGNHQLELLSFDKALEIFPAHVPSLINKAVTLMMEYQKVDDSLKIFERAVQIDKKAFDSAPNAWYWYALGYCLKGDLSISLKHLNSGLTSNPESPYLVNLKSRILLDLSFKNGAYFEECKIFLDKYIKLQPQNTIALDYVILLNRFNENSRAWDIIDDFVVINEKTFKYSDLLKKMGFSVDEVAAALKNLELYMDYRKQRPLDEYSSQKIHPIISAVLETTFAIPFGLGYNFAKSIKMNNELDQQKISEILLLNLTKLTEIFSEYYKIFGRGKDTHAEKSAVLTALIILYTEVVEVEAIKQHIWINRLIGIEQNKDNINMNELMPEKTSESCSSMWVRKAIESAQEFLVGFGES